MTNTAKTPSESSEQLISGHEVFNNSSLLHEILNAPPGLFRWGTSSDPDENLDTILHQAKAVVEMLHINGDNLGEGFSSSHRTITETLWLLDHLLSQAVNISGYLHNHRCRVEESELLTWQIVYEKIRDNEPDSGQFNMAAQFLMNLDCEIGISAKWLFKSCENTKQFKEGLLNLLTQKTPEGGAV